MNSLQESLLIALKNSKPNLNQMDLHLTLKFPQRLDSSYARQVPELGKQKGCPWAVSAMGWVLPSCGWQRYPTMSLLLWISKVFARHPCAQSLVSWWLPKAIFYTSRSHPFKSRPSPTTVENLDLPTFCLRHLRGSHISFMFWRCWQASSISIQAGCKSKWKQAQHPTGPRISICQN